MLATLQAAAEPMTAGEVRDGLGDGHGGELAYTTVLTILVRLREKGIVAREKRGRAYAYRPVSDEAGLAARRMSRVLDEEPDRDIVLARFVGDLSEDDERVLRSLLGE